MAYSIAWEKGPWPISCRSMQARVIVEIVVGLLVREEVLLEDRLEGHPRRMGGADAVDISVVDSAGIGELREAQLLDVSLASGRRPSR
jgi:hypothetical protein